MRITTIALALMLALVATSASAQPTDGDKPATEEPSAAEPEKSETPKAEPPSDGESKAEQSEAESEDLGTLAKQAVDMARAGKWFALIGAILMLIVASLRKLPIDWLKTRIGGWVLSASSAVATTVWLSSQVGFGADAIAGGLAAAGFAIAGHHAVKDAKKKIAS